MATEVVGERVTASRQFSDAPLWRARVCVYLCLDWGRLRFEGGHGRSSARLGVRPLPAQHPGVWGPRARGDELILFRCLSPFLPWAAKRRNAYDYAPFMRPVGTRLLPL